MQKSNPLKNDIHANPDYTYAAEQNKKRTKNTGNNKVKQPLSPVLSCLRSALKKI